MKTFLMVALSFGIIFTSQANASNSPLVEASASESKAVLQSLNSPSNSTGILFKGVLDQVRALRVNIDPRNIHVFKTRSNYIVELALPPDQGNEIPFLTIELAMFQGKAHVINFRGEATSRIRPLPGVSMGSR